MLGGLTESEGSWVLRLFQRSFSSSSITWFMALFSHVSTATPACLSRSRRASAFTFTVCRINKRVNKYICLYYTTKYWTGVLKKNWANWDELSLSIIACFAPLFTADMMSETVLLIWLHKSKNDASFHFS